VSGGDLYVAEVDARVQHGRHERVSEHVGMHPRQADPGLLCKVAETSGRAVTVHPRTAAVQQDGADRARTDGPLACPAQRRG
jgi:hypothetical protein